MRRCYILYIILIQGLLSPVIIWEFEVLEDCADCIAIIAIRIHQLGTKYLLPPNIIVCDKYKCYKNMMEELGYYGFKYQKKPKSKQ